MMRDLLCGLRWLRQNPLFTAVVTVTLALGIGANTAVFSVVDAVLLRPLPYRTPGRLVKIEESTAKLPSTWIPAAHYWRWRERGDLFAGLAAYRSDALTLTDIDTPDQVLGIRATSSLFSLLGVQARLGRTLVASDDVPGSPQTAVLSDKLWRRLFHADPSVIGRSVRAGEDIFTIVGVMPPEFEFPAPDKEIWLPLRLTSASTDAVQVVARLKDGVTIPQVNAAMVAMARQFEQLDPIERAGLRVLASVWTEDAGSKANQTLLLILAAVGLLLAIACANVASLMLSRAVERQKEIAIRACLGAGFWRVMRQLLAESVVLAAVGSAAGIAVAAGLLRVLARRIAALPIVMPHLQQVTVTGRVLAFNAAVCLLVACLFSLVPVLVASKLDFETALRSGRAAGAAKGSTRLFSFLIAGEAALAFLLLAGAGLMVRSLIRLEEADMGIHPDHVLTLKVPIGTALHRPKQFDTRPQQMAYFQQLVERLQTIPGVSAVAVVNNLPLSPANTTLSEPLRSASAETTGNLRARCVSPRYFAVMGIPLLAGRDFSAADNSTVPAVVILNEHLARHLFPDGNAVGRSVSGGGKSSTVIGVVKDAPQMSYEAPAQDEVYFSYQQLIFGSFLAAVVVRTVDDPLALAGILQKEVWAVNRDQPIVKVETMSDVIADSIWRPRFSSWVLAAIGGLALLLMSAGVYGVIAYTANLRAHEVGIRVALGARPREVVAVILRDTMLPVAAGLAASTVAALLLHRLLSSLLYGVSGADPLTYASSAAVLAGVGALASAGPAWKAATADPVKALRSE